MKKIFLALTAVFLLGTLQAQTLKDTIVIDGEILGYLGNIAHEQIRTQHTLRYDIKLFRDITKEERSLITNRYNPGGSPMITFDIDYEYQLQSNEAIAGRLLYEAGELKTQSNNLYVGAALVGIAGGLANSFLINNGDIYQPISVITISTTTIMGIVGLVKNYKANRKIGEAGVYLQKK
jgi:hypothetical protein